MDFMDPDKNLEEQLQLSSKMQKNYEEYGGNGIDQDDAYRLAELVEAMNVWISKGGFLPKAWQPK